MAHRHHVPGAEVHPSTSEELAVFIRDDLAKWVKVVKPAGIKLELQASISGSGNRNIVVLKSDCSTVH